MQKQKLLSKLSDGTWDLIHLREADFTDIYIPGMRISLQYRSIAISDSMSQLFCRHKSIYVLHQLVEFLPEHSASTDGVHNYVENSIATLAQLNAFIATTALGLRKYGTDSVGGHRQKLYH